MSLLHTVTITGADDAVDHRRLFELSAEFPFAEWAILRSSKRSGTNRYPSEPWMNQVALHAMHHGLTARFAAHLCGELCESVLAGNPRTIEHESGLFRRFQLNGWSKFTLPGLRVAKLFHDVEFIAQASSLEAVASTAGFVAARGLTNVTTLFDPSGGRGVALDIDELPPPTRLRTGYAGGITPDNVERVLFRLEKIGQPFWIDMESGVRTNDEFDLDKVYRVLANCRAFAVGESADA